MDKDAAKLLTRPEEFISASSTIQKRLTSLYAISSKGAKSGFLNASDLRKANLELSTAERFLKVMSNELERSASKANKLKLEIAGLNSAKKNDLGSQARKKELQQELDQIQKTRKYTLGEVAGNRKNIGIGRDLFQNMSRSTVSDVKAPSSGGDHPGEGWSDLIGNAAAGGATVAGGPIAGLMTKLGFGVVKAISGPLIASVIRSAKFIEDSSQLQQRGMNISAIRQAGWNNAMGRDESLGLATNYTKTGGSVNASRISKLAQFSRGYGLTGEQAGSYIGSFGGLMGKEGRSSNQMENVIAKAFEKGMVKSDIPQFLDSLQGTLEDLNNTLPTVGEGVQTSVTAMQKALFNSGMTMKQAGKATGGIYSGLSTTEGPFKALSYMATGLTNGKEGMLKVLDKLSKNDKGEIRQDRVKDIDKMKEILAPGDFNAQKNTARMMKEKYAVDLYKMSSDEALKMGIPQSIIDEWASEMLGTSMWNVVAIRNASDKEYKKIETELQDKSGGARSIIKSFNEYSGTLDYTVKKFKGMLESIDTKVGEGTIKAVKNMNVDSLTNLIIKGGAFQAPLKQIDNAVGQGLNKAESIPVLGDAIKLNGKMGHAEAEFIKSVVGAVFTGLTTVLNPNSSLYKAHQDLYDQNGGTVNQDTALIVEAIYRNRPIVNVNSKDVAVSTSTASQR
jgi:hypothetical protein